MLSSINLSANKSFLDTNVARNQVKKLDANLVDQQKNVAGRSVITGASDEANLAANNNVQQNYNDAISNVAANATDYQMDQKRMYQYQKNRLDARQDQITEDGIRCSAVCVCEECKDDKVYGLKLYVEGGIVKGGAMVNNAQ